MSNYEEAKELLTHEFSAKHIKEMVERDIKGDVDELILTVTVKRKSTDVLSQMDMFLPKELITNFLIGLVRYHEEKAQKTTDRLVLKRAKELQDKGEDL